MKQCCEVCRARVGAVAAGGPRTGLGPQPHAHNRHVTYRRPIRRSRIWPEKNWNIKLHPPICMGLALADYRAKAIVTLAAASILMAMVRWWPGGGAISALLRSVLVGDR